jgi:hypothetical protein
MMGLKERFKKGLISRMDAVVEALSWTVLGGDEHGIRHSKESASRFNGWLRQRKDVPLVGTDKKGK